LSTLITYRTIMALIFVVRRMKIIFFYVSLLRKNFKQMKRITICIALALLGFQIGNAQDVRLRMEKAITDPNKGYQLQVVDAEDSEWSGSSKQVESILTPGINWHASDAASIGNVVKVSQTTLKTAVGWSLNYQRLSLYGNSNIPEWEVPFTITAWDESVDMTDDGSRIANGYNDLVEVYLPTSSSPIWTTSIAPLSVRGIQIQNDGQKVFVAGVNQSSADSSIVYCFQVGQPTPLWRKAYAGNYASLVISRSGNRVLLGEYGGGINKVFVLNGMNGAEIFQSPISDQYPPAISEDGKFLVNGDYSGHVFLYEYDDITQTYSERWTYQVNGSGSWVCGMGISADGSTLAVGTLMFTSTGYDGELYVFDTYSPIPLWIYPNMGDMVQSIDLSADGSIIAAATWGPIGNATPDLYLFRKQSNTPYFTVNSNGSLFCVDLSSDGKICVAGGKAVHAREFGMGGNVYNINSDLGGGTLTGMVLKSDLGQLGGSKIEVVGLDTYFTYTDETGHYNLSSIPQGNYTVRYSAIGYITQDISDITINNGQTTTQDVTLEPAGNPPTNLIATQGAGLQVDLSWEASTSPGVVGYNIYRKQYSFEYYPSTPLGFVEAGKLSFADSTALPLIHYYYVVTAKLSGDLQTPYSNEAIGWISTGFITNEISAYYGSTPSIDGIISPGEWSDAFMVDLSNVLGRYDNIVRPIGSVMGYFKVNENKTALYVAVDNKNDVSLKDHDEVALYIDDNNDGSYPEPGDDSEGNYWAVYYGSGNLIKYRPIYNTGGVGTTIELVNPQIEVSDLSGHVVYEFVLPLGHDYPWQINYNANNESGLFVFVLDDPSYYTGWWPCQNMNIFTPEGYGKITFGAIDELPPPPENLQIEVGFGGKIMLHWTQPTINDFNHFNIYWLAEGSPNFTLLDTTVGVQYFYTVPSSGLYKFYVTTVDNTGHESVPSNIVQANIIIGIDEFILNEDFSSIKIWPNPFEGILNIDIEAMKETNLSIRITDMSGKLIANVFDSRISKGYHHFTWEGKMDNGKLLKPGVYLINLMSETGYIQTYKLVVMGRK